jgi:lysophospholipase L1-like esterase
MRRDVFDVAFVGDSLTSSPNTTDWQPAAMSALGRYTSRPTRNYDFGKPAQTTVYGLTQVAGMAALRPAVAVIAFGMNDSDSTGSINVTTFDQNIRQMVTGITGASPATKVVLMTMNPVVAGASTLASNRTQVPNYYAALRVVASDLHLSLIDNYPLWGTPTTATIPDGLHPIVSEQLRIIVPNVIATLSTLV